LPARINYLLITILEKRDDSKKEEFADFLRRKEGTGKVEFKEGFEP
jgi:hypothetical protein